MNSRDLLDRRNFLAHTANGLSGIALANLLSQERLDLRFKGHSGLSEGGGLGLVKIGRT